jgi:flagellar protein FlaF
MYEFAYNEVIEDSRQTMRARERQAMDRVIAMLRTAQEKGPGSRERVEALFYLRRLWMIFLNDLNDPNNELPEQLRAGIISIGIWMMKEIDRVRGGGGDRGSSVDSHGVLLFRRRSASWRAAEAPCLRGRTGRGATSAPRNCGRGPATRRRF